MSATTLSINSIHASFVSHPHEIAELILNATRSKVVSGIPGTSNLEKVPL